MSTLKRNIFSNLAGGARVATLTLIITPLQINLLGVSAIGVIVKWGIEGAAVAYMGLGYFTLGAAVRSDITHKIQRIMQREAKYKKLKCYVLPENLSEKYFADLLSRSYGFR